LGKILVGLGAIPGNDRTNNIELIDLSSNTSICPVLSPLPHWGNGNFGGLDSDDQVLICTNMYCFKSANGLSWTTIPNLNTMRQLAAATAAPYPYSSIFVTGGLVGTMNLTFNFQNHI
jgi:hypothetical protein